MALKEIPPLTQNPKIFRPTYPEAPLTYFSNLHGALKAHMHSMHKLGHANSTTGY